MKNGPTPSDREVLAGSVERVTYQNAENGFCVLRVKARGHRDLVTLVGHAAAIAAGEWITATGDWINDRTHGQQFKARFLKTSTPTSNEGIEKYLASGMIRGIGPVYAKKLLRAFGNTVFDVIEAEPVRLQEVDGIGPVRASRITAAWTEQKVVREIMVFLHSHGVGTARAVRIYKTYGADAVQVMSENPYRLARDIRGIGFKTADAIAMKLGVDKTAMIRVRAGISYALTEAMDDGHCGLPTDGLVPLAEKLLEISQDLIRTALDLELAEGTVIADRVGETDCIFLAGLYRAEQAIAERLLTLAKGKLPWGSIDPDKAIPWIEQRISLTLAESQKTAPTSSLRVPCPWCGSQRCFDRLPKVRSLSARIVSTRVASPTCVSQAAKVIFISWRRMIRKLRFCASSNWSRRGSPSVSVLIPFGTSKFSAL
jgi:exodeoxyribonuclease V alpha subunit